VSRTGAWPLAVVVTAAEEAASPPYDDRANPDSLRAQMGRAAAHEVGARVVARLSARIARENLLADSPVVPG